MSTFHVRLDPDHPTPLYHQITTAIRWRIGTGALRPGDILPAMRDAAEAWQVSYHTVRRAYGQLASDGHVQTRRGDGTRVLARGNGRSDSTDAGVDEFVRDFIAAARRRYGLVPSQLARLVEQTGAAPDAEHPSTALRGAPVVTMVECNDQQAIDLANQIETRWGVAAMPWNLAHRGEPPAGMIVGTRFHQAEMLSRWPHRERDMHFSALRVDPAVVQHIRCALGGGGGLVLVEGDIGTAYQHAADLTDVLPEAADAIVSTEVPDAERLRRSGNLHLIAPRLWDLLEEEVRADERVMLIRHVFDETDAQTLGEEIEGYARGEPGGRFTVTPTGGP